MSCRHVVLCGAFALCMSTPSWLSAQQPRGTVGGVVLNAADGKPIPDASVGIPALGRYVTSDPAGHFRMAGVEFGSQVIEARALGFQPMRQAVTVIPGDSVTVEFRLKAAAVTLPEVVVSTWREEQTRHHAGQRRRDRGGGDPRDPEPSSVRDGEPHSRRLRQQLRRGRARHRDSSADHHQGALCLPGRRRPDPLHRLLQSQRALRDQHPAGRPARGHQGAGHGGVRQRRGGRGGERLHAAIRRATPEAEVFVEGGSSTYLRGLGTASSTFGRSGVPRRPERDQRRRLAGQIAVRPAERHAALGPRAERAQPAQDAWRPSPISTSPATAAATSRPRISSRALPAPTPRSRSVG